MSQVIEPIPYPLGRTTEWWQDSSAGWSEARAEPGVADKPDEPTGLLLSTGSSLLVRSERLRGSYTLPTSWPRGNSVDKQLTRNEQVIGSNPNINRVTFPRQNRYLEPEPTLP